MATISICAKILSTIASPAFEKAYEKGLSIWEAKNELNKLRVTVKTIQAVLNDAENKQEGSDAIKNWIQRLKGVLYDAEDLFDEVLTEDLLKQQMMDGKNKLSLKNKVRVSCSKLNPVVSRNSIANKVKAIRERLAEISTDMNQFKFVQGEPIVNTRRENYGARCSLDPKFVIGRDLDKDSILEVLFNKYSDPFAVIAIVGIGGMGKTTLAHLIYNDEKVKDFFEKKCFACISDSSDDKEVLGKIYQSISEENCSGLNLMQLEDRIRKSLKDKKFLLVLDDVWEEDHGKWTSRKNLLNSGANGSVIVVTTRLQSVVSAVGAVSAHNLKGLSEDDSWNLFKKLAFVSGYENDPRRESLGRELLKRCRGLPLAIWCMGGLLYNKTIREWEEIERVGLPMLKGKHNDEVISILKLSYDHLPSNLKQCFTYCCLFPKDYRYSKEELVYHWIALGYINFDEEESSFMYLLRMGFFQEVEEDEFGEIESYKMHDTMHDLALYLSGEESIVQNGTTLNAGSSTRYVSLMVNYEEGELWDIPKSIRSCMLRSSRYRQPNLDQLCSHFKLLRILTLSFLRIKHIPPSIGELKLVRYLDLSYNNFERLPDSIANLLNLLILNLRGCENLNAWPLNFKNLIKLETLKLEDCYRLSSMPEGIEGMVSLQNLSVFVVEKWSRLHESTEFLNRLRGSLMIKFDREMEAGDELRWQIPSATSLRHLGITDCPSHGIWGWGNDASKMKLELLELHSCKNVKYLPPMSCLPCLKWLVVSDMPELEFIEESEEVNPLNPATSKIFFPSLEKLILLEMEKLKGWRKEVAAEATPTSSTSGATAFLEFSHLRELSIKRCPNFEFESFPKCPDLRNLQLHKVTMPSAIFCSSNWSSLEEIELSECESPSGILGEGLTFVRRLVIQKDPLSLKSLHLASPHLLDLRIEDCDELVSIELAQRPSLRSLMIINCKQLKSLHIEEHLASDMEELKIVNCPELSLLQGLPKVGARKLKLENVDVVVVEWSLSLLSMSSLRDISISKCKCVLKNIDGLQSLHLPSPRLRKLVLEECVGLTTVEVIAPADIDITRCSDLKNFRIAEPTALRDLRITSQPSVDWDSISNLHQCRCLTRVYFDGVRGALILRLLSLPSLRNISLFNSIDSLEILKFNSPHLTFLDIGDCSELKSIELESPFDCNDLSSGVTIRDCSKLNNVRIPRPTTLQVLRISKCPELRLSSGVDWGSLANLRILQLDPLPPVEELQIPQCLLQRHALGNLRIQEYDPRLPWWL